MSERKLEVKSVETLLNKSGELIKADLALRKEKGEDFNIFSILGMDNNEAKTHSAMLSALLNPIGNHYQNEKFLELFLKEINYDYQKEDLKKVKVQAEHYLGKISKDYLSGGFIDLLISFPSGKAIVIENKIKAGDQPKQMYRYSLYKEKSSSLYYLNLFGGEPSSDSLHTLQDDAYSIITYNNHIIKWLENCLAIVNNGSVIENAIKQYQILLKKITNSMDENLEKQLQEIIINNLEEAKYIFSHYEKATTGIKEKFRVAVREKLSNLLSNYTIELGSKDSSGLYSSIWLYSKGIKNKNIVVGLESFSGKGHNEGRMFIGILDKENEYEAVEESEYRLNSYWPLVRDIKTKIGNSLNLSSTNIIEQMFSNPVYFDAMVGEVANQTIDFVESIQNRYITYR